MVEIHEKENFLKVDVEQILNAKNPALRKSIPGFVIRYLKRIVHQDDINDFLGKYGNLVDYEFIAAGLRYFDITYNVFGRENLPPSDGRYIFVSNHPLGGLDGLVFINELSKHYRALKFPVNDILMNLRNLSGIFVPINKHGSQDREAVRLIENAYASDDQILYFPAGLCSRKKGGVIKDLTWHKSFVSKAVQHKRDVVPAFFSGRNSDFFYNLSNIRNFLGIKSNIEMLYLADELFHQRGKEINLVFGDVISWTRFDKTREPGEWAEWVKGKSYDLESHITKRTGETKNV